MNSRAPPRRTDHTYRDFSRFAVDELPLNKKAQSNFPAKLHRILSTPEFSHVSLLAVYGQRFAFHFWISEESFAIFILLIPFCLISFDKSSTCLISSDHFLDEHFLLTTMGYFHPHGRAWKIHNKELFISEVTPKFFAQSKYESFTRQLNGWGFKRLQQPGNDFNAYYHECFLRGLPNLTGMMRRVSPNQGKLLPHVEGEPNFYEIDKRFPLSPTMMPYQGHFQCPPSHMEVGAGYGAPQEPPLGYHTSPNQLSSSSEVYGPPPPFYGHHGHPHVAAAYYPQIGSYPPPLPPTMMPYQGHFQCPPSHMEVGAGYGAPQESPLGYHTGPNQLSSSSEVYGPPPPFYGHHGHPHVAAAYYPQIGSYPPPLPPTMMPYQGHFQCPPSHMEVGAGYGAPQEPPLGYHTSPNQLSSSSEVYGPPPPFYGHHDSAAYNPR
ncbi:LOW QUALITY PROTEIN: hypothetical protein ACHAW5_003963 [Stephanodiscus triporus]|uniref:HSF-type DNA-binding domain-containing protein n=1 Tax=Stephanodiscus triporus TaxID=2934178 RepID=A0ABD3N475_9STRA